MQVTGGVVVIQAKLTSHPDTLQFILDTGSSGISLDSSTVRFLGLTPIFSGQLIRGVGGIREVPILRNLSLIFGELQVDSLDFYVNDYSVLTSVYGVRIDGVIGYALLSRYILTVNYEAQLIEFFNPGTYLYPRKGTILTPQINRLPASVVTLKDLKKISIPMLLDIGAGLNLLLSQRFAESDGVLDTARKSWVTSGEGIGGQITLRLTVLPSFWIGPYKFKKIPITIFDDPYNVTNYPVWGGLIGNDLLRRFNLVINYPKNEIHIYPNKFYQEPFDYSYSGMELYLIDGVVRVGFLAPASPAAQAGIELGDEIIAINKVVSGSLDAYKSELTHAAKKLSIIYKRGNQIKDVKLTLQRIK